MDILILCLIGLMGWAAWNAFRHFSRRCKGNERSPRHEGPSQKSVTLTHEPAGLVNMPELHRQPLPPDNEDHALKGQQPLDTVATYKGYIILPAPRPLADIGMWKVNVYISWSTKYGAVTRQFFTADTYRTEQEAIAHCMTYGQQIIDGKIQGLSLE